MRKLDLRVLLDLSYKLPNLATLACGIGGDEWPSPLSDDIGFHLSHEYQGPRRDSRHVFAQNLDLTHLSQLRDVELNFIRPFRHTELNDQRVRMPNLVAPLTADPFSSSLRMLSYQLRRMCIFAVIDESIFWPEGGGEPSWPKLEVLNVCFHLPSPSGRWYFMGLRDDYRIDGYKLTSQAYPPSRTTDEDEEWCDQIDGARWDQNRGAQFRVVPDNDVLSPLLESFAKAAKLMPALREAALWCPSRFTTDADMDEDFYENFHEAELTKSKGHDLAWGIAYAAPGEQDFTERLEKRLVQSRQLWWMVGNRWNPSARLHDLFRNIGREKHGDNLDEHWKHKFYGDRLVARSIFQANRQRIFPGYVRQHTQLNDD